ncbi:MAG: hypothetical protein ACYTHK_18335 [Planctomycetota bacterium]|jgi:hypothetical protein
MRYRRADPPPSRYGSSALWGWVVFGVLVIAIVCVWVYKRSLDAEPVETAEVQLFVPGETDARYRTPASVDPVWSVEGFQEGVAPWLAKVHDWVVDKTANLIPYQEAKGLPEFWAAQRAMDRADAKARALMVEVAGWAEQAMLEVEAQQYGVDPEDIADDTPLTDQVKKIPVGAVLALFEARNWDARHFDFAARGLVAPAKVVGDRQQADADRFHGYLETLVIRACRKNVLRHHPQKSDYHRDERHLEAPEFPKEYRLARAELAKLLENQHWSTLHARMDGLYGWTYSREDFDRQLEAARRLGLLVVPNPYGNLVR